MEKVTYSLQIRKKTKFLTPTVRRFTAWNVLLFLFLLLAVNAMFIFITVYILHSGIDKRLSHEMDNVIETISITGTDISIIDFSELNEHDFNTISDVSWFLQIYDTDGNVLITSNNLNDFGSIPLELKITGSEFVFSDMNVGEDRLRMGYTSLYNEKGEQVAILQLATFENELWFIRNKMIVFNLILLPGIIIIVIIISVFLAKKSFSPLNKIIETADTISAGNLNTRIDYKAEPEDELGRLRDTLNQLFDRIEVNINQLSQFTDHAAHQMMNPLTAVKTELEYILKKERSADEYKEALNKLLIQTDQMTKIVRTLLMISKQDNNSDKSQSVFNFSNLIQKIVDTEFAKDNIQSSIKKELYVRGDTDKFHIVVENLVDNAIKYSINDKMVSVSLTKNDTFANLIIKDSGIGISDFDKEKVFDRFYRSEKAEKLGIKGYGLGLSLVKLLIEEAGGKISIEDNEPGGTIFIVTLPHLALT